MRDEPLNQPNDNPVQFTLPRVLLTEDEAARALAISPRALWQLRHDGDVPFVALGRSIRYRPSDLETWVAEQVTRQTDRPEASST